MSSKGHSGVEFPPSSINKVQEIPAYQPNSTIDEAIKLLTANDGGQVDPKSISLIPVDLTNNNSVLIRFKKPVDPDVPKAKGLDSHELRIQRLKDTDPKTEDLDRASRDGFDTGHDALIASMNGVQQTYFSAAEVLPSPQMIRLRAKSGDQVDAPLYVPVLFFGPTGKKSVAIITRFPREYIGVEASKSIDRPVGVITVDENKIIRPPSAAKPNRTFQWAFTPPAPSSIPVEEPIPIPTKAVDGNPDMVQIDFEKIEAERASQTPLDTIIAGVEAVKKTRESRRLLKVLDDVSANSTQRQQAVLRWKEESNLSQQKSDSPTVLFGEVAEYIISLQNKMDVATRTNGDWLAFRTGPMFEIRTYAWRVSLHAVNENIRVSFQSYKNGTDHRTGKPIDQIERRKYYVKYAGLKHLLDSEWAVYKKWKD